MKPSEKFNFERSLLNIIINIAQNKYSSNFGNLYNEKATQKVAFLFLQEYKTKIFASI